MLTVPGGAGGGPDTTAEPDPDARAFTPPAAQQDVTDHLVSCAGPVPARR